MNTAVLKQDNEYLTLSNEEFSKIINECDRSLNLTTRERELLNNSPVAKFIAQVPYISNEANPDILACMNLISYIAGTRNGSFFQARGNETIGERIEPYIHSVNGDKETISLCKLVLEEVSLLDHKNDYAKDIKSGHSNPLVSGIIDFQKEKERINSRKRIYPQHIQDLVDSSFKGEVLSSFWTYP